MTQIAVLDPANREYRLYPKFKADGVTLFLAEDDFAGCIREDVADAFTWSGKDVDWDATPPVIVDSDWQALAALRKRRDLLLLATDQTQIREDFSTEDRAVWSAYRAALRAWPTAETNPAEPTEPTAPDADMLGAMVAIIERFKP